MHYLRSYGVRVMNIKVAVLSLVAFFIAMTGGLYVFASTTPTFNQTINAGTLATDIRSDNTTAVASPSVTMSAKTFSFSCLSGGSASTGTFGTNAERIYVDNPDAAANGWTLTLAGSAATAVWTQGGNTFDFNDPTGSGCTDGADTDSAGGQLTVNPAAGTTTTAYSGNSTTGISLGSSTAFSQGVTDSITLVTAASNSADVWRGYFTGIGLSQTIPAEQAAAAYSMNFSLTVTAS